ncbi:MAG: DUF1156 domain-containing protein [Thiotrichales bacterium]|nr:DUF1156 domain-containing protein [Thiotrichales bacterium]
MTGDDRRLIEVAFPLEQVSLDSVHEKNVRHGHISTLHIWPARRPLAACRAALIATLLPDPGDAEERREIYRRLAGDVVETVKAETRGGRTVERRKRETSGGILHWGREGGADLDWFRARIREAYGGRAPKVLDPFAGGGAIPLEAMRLGCEATAIDINPVAWFILKCTLDYPRRLAGATLPLPDFVRGDRDFMEAFLKARGFKGKTLARQLEKLGLVADDGEVELSLIDDDTPPDADLFSADLAWQLRAWGRRVLARVRAALAHRYPTFAEFQALASGGRPFERRALALLEPDANGETDARSLNEAFGAAYLEDPRNPRWVAKPTVAYLWARTMCCKSCRAMVPLLKTRWLCKKDNKRVLLTMTPNADETGVVFGVEAGVPPARGNAAQRREDDKRLGVGTMSRSGARCPCCSTIMTMEDIRLEGRAGRLGAVMTAVVVDGPKGKEYRLPQEEELPAAEVSPHEIDALYADIPFGLPTEPTPRQGPGASRAFSVENYGLDQWAKLFTDRQRVTQSTVIKTIIDTRAEMVATYAYGSDIADAIAGFLACIMDRQADYGSAGCIWVNVHEKIGHQFSRFALPIVWDVAEVCPLTTASGGLESAYEWVTKVVDHLVIATAGASSPAVELKSAIDGQDDLYDVIVTDPPYYDAIPYSDLMDFFYVWLRRLSHGIGNDLQDAFSDKLGPKWNAESANGELIDDASRFGGDKEISKQNYENGMARAFQACHQVLRPKGRLVVVFASKSPSAWETLVAALIRAGFVVDGSWPIQTERQTRLRSVASAALASSIWLVCRKRPPAGPGWDAAVLTEMRENITRRLHDFWDTGIRGPDFVWAATGPALEAFSKYPVVKKADQPGALMTVSEFLREVRRMVVDFVVGRVLTGGGDANAMSGPMSGLDDVTTYYLLHRGDFGMDEAPAGACILYALSCNLSDRDLSDRFEVLSRTGRVLPDAPDDEEAGEVNADSDSGGGKAKLVPWARRKAKWLGYEGPGGRPVPLIDRAHRLMHLWRSGEEARVNAYIDDNGLARNALFARLLQALIELAPAGSGERAILESLSNHIAARAGLASSRQSALGLEAPM